MILQYRISLGAALLAIGLSVCSVVLAQPAGKKEKAVTFRMQTVDAQSKFEAATAVDIDRDGRLDIFSGGFWYQAPRWTRHFVREVEEKDEYYYDFAAIPADIDGDGWTDIVDVAWHNKSVFWIRNPGKTGKSFEVFTIDTPGNMETLFAADINGDRQLDFVPNVMNRVVWYEYRREIGQPNGVRWITHEVSKEVAGHGLGAGDINGDGRVDLVVPKGWLEQPAQADEKWIFHADFDLGSASIPILIHDVDGDGDSDLIYGAAHNYGLYWMEQTGGTAEGKSWIRHEMDKSWSQPHFLLLADLDRDGKKELITGKRYRAHNGKDPGSADPRVIYYYSFDRDAKSWQRHPVSEAGGPAGLGINTVAVDMDKDGDLDILAPGKSGLYLFENLLVEKKK